MISLHHERMNGAFEKQHVVGLPVPLALHRFTEPDRGDPHDHPWGFTSFIVSGGYVEEVFTLLPGGAWTSALVRRVPGTAHHVPATHIHRIVELPAGECWTCIIAGSVERESRFWRFAEGQIMSRPWHSLDFVPL